MTTDPPEDLELELVDSTDDAELERARQREARDALELAFSGELWYWRGPAPYHFVTVPPEHARTIRSIASSVTYGWGMIPATVRIGTSTWQTALWPKDGGYVVPIKDRYRKDEGLALGDVVDVAVVVRR